MKKAREEATATETASRMNPVPIIVKQNACEHHSKVEFVH